MKQGFIEAPARTSLLACSLAGGGETEASLFVSGVGRRGSLSGLFLPLRGHAQDHAFTPSSSGSWEVAGGLFGLFVSRCLEFAPTAQAGS